MQRAVSITDIIEMCMQDQCLYVFYMYSVHAASSLYTMVDCVVKVLIGVNLWYSGRRARILSARRA